MPCGSSGPPPACAAMARTIRGHRQSDRVRQKPRRGIHRPILSAARRTTAQLCEVRYAVVRDARRCSSSFRISVRAVGQLVGWTWPSATSRERRSNSVAQAAATSSSGSSRLESSSSATRARSARARRRASAKSSSVDMGSVWHLGLTDFLSRRVPFRESEETVS